MQFTVLLNVGFIKNLLKPYDVTPSFEKTKKF